MGVARHPAQPDQRAAAAGLRARGGRRDGHADVRDHRSRRTVVAGGLLAGALRRPRRRRLRRRGVHPCHQSGTSDGLEYTVDSLLPRYDAADLQAANAAPDRDRRTSSRAARRLPGRVGRPGPLGHRRGVDPVRPGHRPAELVPRLHLRPVVPRRAQPGRDGRVRRRAARLLRAVRRHLRRPRPGARVAVTGRGRVHPRRPRAPTAATTCAASTPTPGRRSTSTASAGCRSSPPPGEAFPPPCSTPASPPPRPTTVASDGDKVAASSQRQQGRRGTRSRTASTRRQGQPSSHALHHPRAVPPERIEGAAT